MSEKPEMVWMIERRELSEKGNTVYVGLGILRPGGGLYLVNDPMNAAKFATRSRARDVVKTHLKYYKTGDFRVAQHFVGYGRTSHFKRFRARLRAWLREVLL